MRVISQHGNVDLPYEQIVVCHAMGSVIALYNGEKYVLGEYSSKEKAYKAMEMLRKVYARLSEKEKSDRMKKTFSDIYSPLETDDKTEEEKKKQELINRFKGNNIEAQNYARKKRIHSQI